MSRKRGAFRSLGWVLESCSERLVVGDDQVSCAVAVVGYASDNTRLFVLCACAISSSYARMRKRRGGSRGVSPRFKWFNSRVVADLFFVKKVGYMLQPWHAAPRLVASATISYRTCTVIGNRSVMAKPALSS